MSVDFKIDRVMKTFDKGHVKIDGALKQIDKIWTKVDGVLRQVYNSIPGPSALIAGDTNSGYYGELRGFCTGGQFRTLTNTANLIIYTDRILTGDNEDIRFFKLIYNNKILFIPDYPILRDISLDNLTSRGLVDGSFTINLNGYKFKVRLINIGGASLLNIYGNQGKIFNAVNEYEDCYFKYIPSDSYTKQCVTNGYNFRNTVLANKTSVTNWNMAYDCTLVAGVGGDNAGYNNSIVCDCINYAGYLKYESYVKSLTYYTYEDGKDKTHYEPFLWRPVLELVQ